MKKTLTRLAFSALVLLLSNNCQALSLDQMGDWFTRGDLPRVIGVVDRVLKETNVTPLQKEELQVLKKHLENLQVAEKGIDDTKAEWDRVNDELNKIHHKGIDKNGHPYAWSGHTTADNEVEPRWEEVQRNHREANSEASSKRMSAKAAIRRLSAMPEGVI